jgi:hypothetical protein
MKYPHLAPVGSNDSSAGWRLAGTDLDLAEVLLGNHGGAGVDVIRLVEVLRRRGSSAEGRALLHTLRPQRDDAPLIAYAIGTRSGRRETASMPVPRIARH